MSVVSTQPAVAFGGVGDGAANPLRVIAAGQSVMADLDSHAGLSQLCFRWPYLIGANASSMVFSFNNWRFNSSTQQNSSNVVTILSMAVETPGGSSVPVYFSGSRSVALAGGANDIKSDAISAATLGYGKISVGQIYWVRGIVQTDAAGGTIPYANAAYVGDVSGSQSNWFNPANTTVSTTDTTGVYTYTGTAWTGTISGFKPLMLGAPVNRYAPSFFYCGDSIADAAGDAASGSYYGRGFVARGMRNAASTVAMPCLGFAEFGTGYSLVGGSNTYWKSYLKYARFAIDEFGTNDVTGGVALATLQTNAQALWTAFRTGGIQKIIRTKLVPRTTSTDSFVTTANQSYASNCAPGGTLDNLNSWFDAQATAGTIDYVLQNSTVHDGTLPFKWAVNGTTNYMTVDGTHPSSVGHENMAVQLRQITLPLGGLVAP